MEIKKRFIDSCEETKRQFGWFAPIDDSWSVRSSHKRNDKGSAFVGSVSPYGYCDNYNYIAYDEGISVFLTI